MSNKASSRELFLSASQRASAAGSWASTRSASGDAQNRVIALTRGEFEDGGNIRRFKQRIILQDLLARSAGRQEIQDVLDANAQGPDARTSAALLWINGDAVQFAHNRFLSHSDSVQKTS